MLLTLISIGLVTIAGLWFYIELVRQNKDTQHLQVIRVRASDRNRRRK